MPLKGRHAEQKAKAKAQLAQLKQVMGTGPVLHGVEAADIQQSKLLSTRQSSLSIHLLPFPSELRSMKSNLQGSFGCHQCQTVLCA